MMEQRTPEWFAARAGKVTASRIADVMAVLKSGGPGASRTNYAAELVTERLTGASAPRFQNDAMRWGTETEHMAREAYVLATFNTVEEVGFVDHPSIEMAGASPDGLVNDDGLIEIKCPNTATHIETLLNGDVPAKYVKQMQFQMACTGRAWCDFVSFEPRLPDGMQMFIKRIDRSDNEITEIEEAVTGFLADVAQTVADLQARYAA